MLSRTALVSIVPAVFALDRVTKIVIEAKVSFWDNYVVIPNFFSIVHTQNKGAAFGMFSDSSSEWRTLFLVGVSVIVMVFVAAMLMQSLRRLSPATLLTALGLSLVLGGAMGNMFDRIIRGSVTDFLLFYVGEYQWPAFNVADSAICIGAGLLIWDMWRGSSPKKAANAS